MHFLKPCACSIQRALPRACALQPNQYMRHIKPDSDQYFRKPFILLTSWPFFQVQDGSEPGNKVKAFYRLFDLPVIMVIDPITGLALRTWTGAMETHRSGRKPKTTLSALMQNWGSQNGPRDQDCLSCLTCSGVYIVAAQLAVCCCFMDVIDLSTFAHHLYQGMLLVSICTAKCIELLCLM